MSDYDPWKALELNDSPENEKEREAARLAIKRHFKTCFESPDGEWVLNYLNGKYFNRPIVDENATNVLASASIREGELRLLRFIHMMMQPEQ